MRLFYETFSNSCSSERRKFWYYFKFPKLFLLPRSFYPKSHLFYEMSHKIIWRFWRSRYCFYLSYGKNVFREVTFTVHRMSQIFWIAGELTFANAPFRWNKLSCLYFNFDFRLNDLEIFEWIFEWTFKYLI